MVYIAVLSEALVRGVAAPAHAIEHVVELFILMHDCAFDDGSFLRAVPDDVFDAIVLVRPVAEEDHVVVGEELDLENVVP
jgi:hypothetical protein